MNILVSYVDELASSLAYDRYNIDLLNFSFDRSGVMLIGDNFVDATKKGGSYYNDELNSDYKIISDIFFINDDYPPYISILGTVYLNLDLFKVSTFTVASTRVNSSSFSEFFIFSEPVIKSAYKSVYLKTLGHGDISANVFINFHKDFISIYRPTHFYTNTRVVEYTIYKIQLKKEFTKCCLKQCFQPNKYILYKD